MAETPPLTKPVRDDAAAPPREPNRRDREPLWRDALGERLRSLRRERGEKLADTASRAGISPQYLSEMERGLKEPSSEMIAAVAGALDTTLADLALGVAERLRAAEVNAIAGVACRAAYALAA
ncbi:helix-turn-helix domain-containing protein [Glycomyces tarimensis]